ncbi:oxaloacetate decarboxylase subunit gamma [Saccharobesus litoralis]|uniref:Probable oxaloacetate decarboxylase gamma chain n=1 Tax=Saccharobesus litoralis TaxID=2172099 RepID=A0A2S0VXX5_9ALTE|nr:OadG family transporter subunit [Saccharobesus litoralis]AWB69064.1 oxaloacetate decarboxylase subunit gamma [Saccharobesus litoralis]
MENLSSTLLEAANLMLVGMVVVFGFLSLLIVCIQLMSKAFAGEVETSVTQPSRRPAVQNDQARAAQTTAAISAAIHKHRQK